ncbi:helix-turn-helix domain-containing protein [Zophobihabitans entericus]|uniref:Transcriptional regulator n=1 Tax=Zophobihabitans entericus TaxID=1635327 RepID=A0A6G9IFA6_9GAMM|nr:helix-turn-helix transcriptional regulator [Zophobihabitans entericus]QIQ22270.1 transcriptional regulator [Zophobihabitans entericus]
MKKIASDWHPADILAELKKRGLTLAELSRQSGFSSSTLSNALIRPWTKGEVIIANALDKKPEEIWPSRYIDKYTQKPIKRTIRATSEKNRSNSQN